MAMARGEFDLFLVEEFLDAAAREAVLADMHAAAGANATVHGHGRTETVVPRVRHAMQLAVSDATRHLVDHRLDQLRPLLAQRFGVALTAHEPPQFLRYEIGGFFVAHQDGNTPLIRDQSRHRRVSVVIFLNAQTAEGADGGYDGGALVFHAPYPHGDRRHAMAGSPGALLAFRSETTHEVAMVTAGVRYTIATWFRAEDSLRS